MPHALMGPEMAPVTEYVIERLEARGGGTVFIAIWVAAPGDGRPPDARRFIGAETLTGCQEIVARHYPWAVCRYAPPDVAETVQAVRVWIQQQQEGGG